MRREIEISSLDLRYECRRLKNRLQEGRLLSAIAECGIEEPLEGFDLGGVCVLLKDLEIVGKYMQRVTGKSNSRRLKTRAFHAQANLLTAGILSGSTAFIQTMRALHDNSGQA